MITGALGLLSLFGVELGGGAVAGIALGFLRSGHAGTVLKVAKKIKLEQRPATKKESEILRRMQMFGGHRV